jgi:hypothetical protein
MAHNYTTATAVCQHCQVELYKVAVPLLQGYWRDLQGGRYCARPANQYKLHVPTPLSVKEIATAPTHTSPNKFAK